MTDALFDAPAAPSPATPEKLSADRARTERQRLAITAGRHPLENVWPTYRHPETKGLAYERTDEKGRPHTCGSCRFRQVLAWHNRSYAKCVQGDDAPRATHGAASDVRAWWPGCTKYEAGDGALSPDAARCLPGGAS
jgi:hypothetical protein